MDERRFRADDCSDRVGSSLKNNRPLLAYISGKADQFTTKDHNFLPGETVEKQLIVINNSAHVSPVQWSLNLPVRSPAPTVAVGEQVRARCAQAATHLPKGPYELTAMVRFSNGETQSDTFTIHVLPNQSSQAAPASRGSQPTTSGAAIALFDPKRETEKLLTRLNIRFDRVDADADLSRFKILVVGKEAISPSGPAPDVLRVRDGLKVVVFEQSAKALEQRLGFRVAEYGLRKVFARAPDHPALAELTADQLGDWRGAAPARRFNNAADTARPCSGASMSRGRGVAAVAATLPCVDQPAAPAVAGYSLQYSLLLEYRKGGDGPLCQLDVSGRTEVIRCGHPNAQHPPLPVGNRGRARRGSMPAILRHAAPAQDSRWLHSPDQLCRPTAYS